MTSNPNLNQPNSRRVTATYNIPISLLLQGCLRLFYVPTDNRKAYKS